MKRVQLITLIFCKRQDTYVGFMDKMGIGKITGLQDCYDPITKQLKCRYIRIEVISCIMDIYCFILKKMMDDGGTETRERLLRIGAIKIIEE